MLDPVAAEALLEPSTVPAPSTSSSKPIPAGLTPYTEQSTTILLPDDNTAFLNPVQQFNRDLSISVISTWGKVWQEEGRKDWEDKRVKKLAKKGGKKGGKGKGKQQEEPVAAAAAAAVDSAQEPAAAADVTASETDAAAEVAEPVNAEVRLSLDSAPLPHLREDAEISFRPFAGLDLKDARLPAQRVRHPRSPLRYRSESNQVRKGDPRRQVRDRQRPVADGGDRHATERRLQRAGREGHQADGWLLGCEGERGQGGVEGQGESQRGRCSVSLLPPLQPSV